MNILAHSERVTQPTSYAMLVTASDIFTPSGVRQSTPTSATIITTPPVFGGVTAVTPKTDGSFNVAWGSVTSINLPYRFEIYVALGTVSAAALFAMSPAAVANGPDTSLDVMKLNDHATYFVKDQTYTFGVRCKDGVGNLSTTLAAIQATAIASGNLVEVLQAIAQKAENASNLMMSTTL
jgi:hypothetical protein